VDFVANNLVGLPDSGSAKNWEIFWEILIPLPLAKNISTTAIMLIHLAPMQWQLAQSLDKHSATEQTVEMETLETSPQNRRSFP